MKRTKRKIRKITEFMCKLEIVGENASEWTFIHWLCHVMCEHGIKYMLYCIYVIWMSFVLTKTLMSHKLIFCCWFYQISGQHYCDIPFTCMQTKTPWIDYKVPLVFFVWIFVLGIEICMVIRYLMLVTSWRQIISI